MDNTESVLQHGAQRGSKESNTKTLNNRIRQMKNKYQQILSKKTKALSHVASASSINSNDMRSSLTLAQLAGMCDKKKARSVQVTQSQHELMCANQNTAFTKSPNEMSSTEACSDDLLDQASSINLVSNLNRIKENTLNKLGDRSNDRMQFVGNKIHNPYDANIIIEQAKAYEQATQKMNEKIRELTSYVDAMKKTNTSDKITLFTNIRNVISAIKAKHLS